VFAREEFLLAGIPSHQRNGYYADRVLPLKRRLDEAYMSRATFASDLRLLVLTIMRVWTSIDDADDADDAGMSSAVRSERMSAPLPVESCD
jgi:hypothetical protein